MKINAFLLTAFLSAVLLLISHLTDTASTLHFFFIGGYSGWKIRSRWFLPLIPVAMVFLFALFFGEIADSQTVMYAGFVLLIGLTSMLLAAMVRSFAPKR